MNLHINTTFSRDEYLELIKYYHEVNRPDFIADIMHKIMDNTITTRCLKLLSGEYNWDIGYIIKDILDSGALDLSIETELNILKHCCATLDIENALKILNRDNFFHDMALEFFEKDRDGFIKFVDTYVSAILTDYNRSSDSVNQKIFISNLKEKEDKLEELICAGKAKVVDKI